MARSRNRHYWMALTVFGAVTLCSTMVIVLRQPYSGSTRKTTAQRIGEMQLRDAVTGQRFNVPSKRTTFVFYYNFASPQNLQDISYAAYLVKRFHPKDVDFVAITGGHFSNLEEMRRTGVLPFPLVVDSGFALARSLTVPQDADRSFVIAQDGELLFAPWTGSFSPEEIRELYERFTHGHIKYALKPPSAGELVGKPFPNIPVKDALGKVDLLFSFSKPGRSDYLVFTASCPACMIESTLRRQDLFSANITVVITSRVPEVELRSILDGSHIPAQIYLAQNELPGFEDVYFDFGALESSVLRVQVGDDGIIKKVMPLQ